jgi:hypothetical protein
MHESKRLLPKSFLASSAFVNGFVKARSIRSSDQGKTTILQKIRRKGQSKGGLDPEQREIACSSQRNFAEKASERHECD